MRLVERLRIRIQELYGIGYDKKIKNMKKIVLIIVFTWAQLNAQTGIGTTTPAVKLHVKSNGPVLRLEGSDHAYMEFYPQGTGTRYGYLGFPNASSTQLTFMNQFSAGSIAFGTNGTSRMFLNSDGKLGFGTSNPGTSLHIENGNTFGTPANTTTPSIYVMNTNNASSTANATISVRTAGTGSGKPFYSLDVSGAYGYSMGINNPTDQMILNTSWDFNTTATNNAIIINRTGQSRVIIPAPSGAYAADWPSGWGGGLATFDFSCAGIYYNTLAARSDKRLKNTIESISNELIAKYLQLRPVSYYWNQGKSNDTKLQYGLIAQEVEPLFPEMVNTGTDEMQTKSVNYQALHALSLKVIQNQQAEIEELKKKQSDLEVRLLQLEAKLK
ncbi:MAG: hypothetical protein RLZZ529_592 [Bacteroidota bacterium]|jgi:Chaperone of endosialidase